MTQSDWAKLADLRERLREPSDAATVRRLIRKAHADAPPAQTIPPEAWATAIVPPDEAPRPANRLSRVVDTPWTPHPKPGVKR